MDLEAFGRFLAKDAPPESLNVALQPRSMRPRAIGPRTHGARAWARTYLHGVEGDDGNTGYWYGRAGKSRATGSLKRAWEEIVSALCEA